MQWLVLSRVSLQGFQGHLPHLTQRTSSITLASHFPLRGRPYGHREALLLTLQLFKSSTCHSRLQPERTRNVLALLQLSENTKARTRTQGPKAVETFRNLWETLFWACLSTTAIRSCFP